MAQFELKKFKSQRGREGIGFSAQLYVDGVKAADVIDDANGAPFHWHWFSQATKRKWDAYVAAQPEREFGDDMPGTFKPDGDSVIAALADDHENRQKMKRQCRTHTLFRLTTDKPDIYRTMKIKFSPQVATQLQTKYGESLAEIINVTMGVG